MFIRKRDLKDDGRAVYRLPRKAKIALMAFVFLMVIWAVRDGLGGPANTGIHIHTEEYLSGEIGAYVQALGGADSEPEVEGYQYYAVCGQVQVASKDGERIDRVINEGSTDVGIYGVTLKHSLEVAEEQLFAAGFVKDEEYQSEVFLRYRKGEEALYLSFRGSRTDVVGWERVAS